MKRRETGSYELLEHLGSGATAEAWRAASPSGDSVLLKIGHSEADAPRLAAEAIPCALATSRRLPSLVDAGRLAVDLRRRRASAVDGKDRTKQACRPFLALRFRPGSTLDAVLAASAGSTTRQLAANVAAGVGAALAELHDLGLAHGDVKPANVLCHQGDAGLVDRGLVDLGLIDLGLATDGFARELVGGTPRYLATGDRELGDARTRDLLALGIVLAELVEPDVRHAKRPIELARTCRLDGPIGAIAHALLAKEPGARPSAQWVARRAAPHASAVIAKSAGVARSVRATYLRLRRHELAHADRAAPDAAPWLGDALRLVHRARTLGGSERAPHLRFREREGVERVHTLGPLDAERRQRWLVALVGPAALGWPKVDDEGTSERELALALEELEARRTPQSFTFSDLDTTLRGRVPIASVAMELASPPSPPQIARIALAIARPPVPTAVLELVESHAAELPDMLVLEAANALRLRGDLGRARALLFGREGGGGLSADILRRAGDIERATKLAEAELASGRDHDGRARACLGRMRLDAGDVAGARALVAAPRAALEHEVAALAAMADADPALAHSLAERGLARAATDEERARLSATLAYVLGSRMPEASARGFRRAAEHAALAGAVLEEATYRTGEAASAVDRGDLAAADHAARRSALLFEEVLKLPDRAARAWLSRAAVHAALDAELETALSAEEAVRLAHASGDRRAELYAMFAVADAHPIAHPRALEALTRAGALAPPYAAERVHLQARHHSTAQSNAVSYEGVDDRVQLHARLHRHGLDLGDLNADSVDAMAAPERPLLVDAKLAWWGARAERLLAVAPGPERGERVVIAALVALARAECPIPTLGRAAYFGAELASRAGDATSHDLLETTRRAAAETVLAHSTGELAEAARSTRWLCHPSVHGAPALPAAIDLPHLCRSLAEREDLEVLLHRALDLLLGSTGAERGICLLATRSGELRPRVAQNLGRRELSTEQLELSQSLARRALETGMPVVAADAMTELSSSHASIHALSLRSVLVIPLIARGEIQGVVYLDDKNRRAAFGDREVASATAIAPLVAVAIADARAQAALRRAARRADIARTRIERTLAEQRSARELAEEELRRRGGSRHTRHAYDEIVGTSAPLTELLRLVDRVAAADVPVLVHGESGTGKELITRAIHRHSPRADHAFVTENCAALPETLLESALFGHVRGAFTGATDARLGLFEAADAGTLFLDEVGEMSLAMQTKLLRVLEDGDVRPVGSTKSRRVNVRVIAATHRDLTELTKSGRFREDLLYRLDVVALTVPPLRERPSDIPLLTAHLVEKHAGNRRITVTAAARRRLASHAWPGNVRQLENELRRALVMCDEVLDVEHLALGESAAPAVTPGLDVRARKDELESRLVGEALEQTRGNQTQAAKLLGLSRFGLQKMMARLGIAAARRARS